MLIWNCSASFSLEPKAKLDWRALVDLDDLTDLEEDAEVLEDLRAVVEAEDCILEELSAD